MWHLRCVVEVLRLAAITMPVGRLTGPGLAGGTTDCSVEFTKVEEGLAAWVACLIQVWGKGTIQRLKNIGQEHPFRFPLKIRWIHLVERISQPFDMVSSHISLSSRANLKHADENDTFFKLMECSILLIDKLRSI